MSKIMKESTWSSDAVVVGGEPIPCLEMEEETPEIDPEEIVEERIQARLAEQEERHQIEKEQAYRSGFEDGRDMGLREGTKEGQEAVKAFFSAGERLQAEWEQLQKQIERALLTLSLSMARKIVGEELRLNETVLARTVEQAVAHLVDPEAFVVKLHPEDVEKIHTLRPEWSDTMRLEGDPRIGPGGCMIETGAGGVDARLEHQLRVLEETVWGTN
jgi:flagellar biosynthesis/type III secretory pathway protein FliH